MTLPSPFLTADWRHLVMLNYEIDPALLEPYRPRGTELDYWQGRAYVSIVGFLFLDTRLLGVPIPFHSNFEELNLRFYVRRRGPEGWRRGVVFIKELVPRLAVAQLARLVYNENYAAVPMRHRIMVVDEAYLVEYLWQFRGRWGHLRAEAAGPSHLLVPGSEAEFITEHYWGYAAQRDGSTIEYRVEHPRWRIWPVKDYSFECDVARLYGPQFVAPLKADPTSAFLAAGSAVVVRQGVRLVKGSR